LLFVSGKHLTGTLALWPDDTSQGGSRGQDRILFHDGAIVGARPLQPATSALEALVGLFERSSAPYAFYEGQNLLGAGEGALNERVDLFTLLSRGLRAHAQEESMDAELSRVADRPLRIRAGVPLDRLELLPKERALIDVMRAGPATALELIRSTELEPRDAKRILYLLTLIRGIEADQGSGFASIRPGAIPSAPTGQRTLPTGPSSAISRGVTLGDAPAPFSVRPGVSGPKSIPVTFSSAPPDIRTEPAPPPPSRLTNDELTRWVELASLHDRLDSLTHFELLSVAKTAPAKDISSAYFALVKKFHPDRLPEPLKPLARCAQLVFDRATEANSVLADPAQRDEYVKAVDAGGGTRAAERMMRNVLESAVEYQKAEVLMRRREVDQAMEMLQSALAKNPDEGDYHAMYAWLLHLKHPSEPAPFDDMLRALDKALTQNARNERAHYYKGVVLKRMKRDKEAVRHFKQAMEINPRNVDAAREVRLATMRRDSKPPSPGASSGKLLSKLFGKGN
jgi:tetratricopeptide (TPR) repeat protein